MKKLTIPSTDLTVTPIAIGAAQWKGADASRMIDCLLDLGGQVIDTARIYGLPQIGASEEAIGQWIQHSGRRNEIVLLSKGGHPNVRTMHKSRMSMPEMTSDLHESLNALHTDYIDVYFYHRDDLSRPVGELIDQMETFRQAGKIRYYACSNWTTARMREADEYARKHGLTGFIGSECMYNAGSPSAKPNSDDTMVTVDAEMLAYHRDSKNVMMPYSGLCNGFFHKLIKPGLLDKLTLKGSIFYTDANLRNAKRIQALQQRYSATVTQVLTGYFFTLGMPVLPLIGTTSPEHLQEILATLDIPFQDTDFSDFE